MRPPRIRRVRRRPHHFHFRPRGFSDPLSGPAWRGLFGLFGIKREQRRTPYNFLALSLLIFGTFCFGITSCASQGPGAGIGGIIGGLAMGWIVITVFRFFR